MFIKKIFMCLMFVSAIFTGMTASLTFVSSGFTIEARRNGSLNQSRTHSPNSNWNSGWIRH